MGQVQSHKVQCVHCGTLQDKSLMYCNGCGAQLLVSCKQCFAVSSDLLSMYKHVFEKHQNLGSDGEEGDNDSCDSCTESDYSDDTEPESDSSSEVEFLEEYSDSSF